MKPIALLTALVALAVAQHWDVEQVDSAGWGASVDMRWHPDGRLFLCYSDTSGIIRLASKDSIWSYEDLLQWRPIRSGTQAFDIDHRGDIGVSYIGTDNLYWYALKTDTGWADIQTPFNAGPYYPSPVTLDTAGAPAICVQLGDAYKLARRRDTVWVTYALASGFSGWTNDFDCSALGSTDDVIWGVFRYTYHYPPAFAYGTCLYSFQARDSDVSVVQITDDVLGGAGAASGCVDAHGSVHSAYNHYTDLGSSRVCVGDLRSFTSTQSRGKVMVSTFSRRYSSSRSPYARRWMTRTLLFSPSTKPSENFCSSRHHAAIPSQCRSTNATNFS